MLQEIETNLVRLLNKHGKLTTGEFHKLTGSRSLPTMVLNVNRKFDEPLIKNETEHTRRVTFDWNRKKDAETITYYYLNENWEEMLMETV